MPATAMVCIPCADRHTIIYMAAVPEITAIPETVSYDDRVSVVHKTSRSTPAGLVEVAGRSRIVPGVSDMTATGKAADMARTVALSGEVRDESLKAPREAAGDGYGKPHGGLDGYYAALENTLYGVVMGL